MSLFGARRGWQPLATSFVGALVNAASVQGHMRLQKGHESPLRNWGQLTWEFPFFMCLFPTFIFLVLRMSQILLHESALCWSLVCDAWTCELGAPSADVQ